MEFTSTIGLAILVATVAINIILAIFVYINNPRSITNIIFALMALSLSAWIISMFVASAEQTLLRNRMTLVLATPMNLLFFLFAHTMPSTKIQMGSRNFWLLMLIGASIVAFALSPYAFTDIQLINGVQKPVSGPGMPV